VASSATAQVQGGITSGALALTISGTGALGATGALENVSGSNTYAGAIILGASGSSISSDAGLLTLSGTIYGSATGYGLVLTGSGNGVASNVFNGGSSTAAGAGTLTKSGAGTWTLSAANTYTGATTVSGGTLIAPMPNRWVWAPR
jgi:autotransporter-associated beta strand protein